MKTKGHFFGLSGVEHPVAEAPMHARVKARRWCREAETRVLPLDEALAKAAEFRDSGWETDLEVVVR